MAGLLENLFGGTFRLGVWGETASASVAGTGTPAATSSVSGESDTGAISMDAQLSNAGKKYSAKRSSVPAPGAIDDLINVIKAVRTQYGVRSMLEDTASYMAEGFRVKGAPGKSADVRQFVLATELETRVWRIFYELVTVGWVVVYASEMDKQGFPGLTALHNCTVTRGVDGKSHVFLRLSDDAKTAITANSKNYPKYWQQQVESDNGIEITRIYDNSGKLKQGGAYFISLEPEGEDVYPVSPLYPVLGDSIDAEKFAKVMGDLMDLVKFYWFQIRIGNDKGQDERDGRAKPITKERITQVGSSFGLGIKSGALLTPGDVHGEHHSPEVSPWAMPRSERNALTTTFQDQVGLPDFANAASEGAANMMAKAFLPRLKAARSIVMTKFVEPFLLDMGKRFPQMDGSYAFFGEEAIQDLGTLIQLHRQLLATGGYSIQTINEKLDRDYDFDREMVRKEYEAGFKSTVGNLYEAGQGLAGADATTTQTTNKTTSTPASKTTKKGTSGDPASASSATQTSPTSQPGRPSK